MLLIEAPSTDVGPVPLVPGRDDCLVGIVDGYARYELDVLNLLKV